LIINQVAKWLSYCIKVIVDDIASCPKSANLPWRWQPLMAETCELEKNTRNFLQYSPCSLAMKSIDVKRTLAKWLHGEDALRMELDGSSQSMGWSKTKFIIYPSNSIFMGDTMEHNKLCSLYGWPKATYVCFICNCPGTLLDEPSIAMTLENKRDRKCKGERIPPNIFILTDAKKIKLNHSIKVEKVVEVGYYLCIENLLYNPLGINI